MIDLSASAATDMDAVKKLIAENEQRQQGEEEHRCHLLSAAPFTGQILPDDRADGTEEGVHDNQSCAASNAATEVSSIRPRLSTPTRLATSAVT